MRTGHVPWWRSLFERTDEALRAQLWAGEWIYAQQAQLAKLTGDPQLFQWFSAGFFLRLGDVGDVDDCLWLPQSKIGISMYFHGRVEFQLESMT